MEMTTTLMPGARTLVAAPVAARFRASWSNAAVFADARAYALAISVDEHGCIGTKPFTRWPEEPPI
jgi:hypothetical protein